MHLSKGDRVTLAVLGMVSAVLLVLVAVLLVQPYVVPSNVRQALPASATDVKEYFFDSPFAKEADTTLYVRARMPEGELPGVAAKLGLTQRYSAAYHVNLPMSFSGTPDWWASDLNPTGAYINVKLGRSRMEYCIAQYQNGFVYVKSTY